MIADALSNIAAGRRLLESTNLRSSQRRQTHNTPTKKRPWPRERCTESGIVMEEFEESEDDEDPNKPGPVEAYAFRACGKACGTCE